MAMMASNGELDAFGAEYEPAEGGVVVVISVTEVEVSRSVAEGVEVLAEVDDWI